MKLSAFSIIVLLLFGCKTHPSVDSAATQGVEVSLVNIGELMSTYKLQQDTAAVRAIQSITWIDSKQMEEIFKYSTEANWPVGLSNLPNRVKNTTLIKTYQAFQIASFNNPSKGTLYILKVPVKQTTTMPTDLVLTNDIFLVMTSKGFSPKLK